MVNNYDKFAKARQKELLKGEKKPHRYVEKPMMLNMLPNLTQKKVLMIGCGTGEETKLLSSVGASNMTGIDLSEVSIQIAKETYPQYEFLVTNMHKLPFESESFDFVYSSLAIHYSDKPNLIYDEVYRVLKKNGMFLFSIGHPLRWASTVGEVNHIPSRIMGYSNEGYGDPILYGNYTTFAPHEHFFPNEETLRFYVGSPSLHFKLLRKSGFVVDDFTESKCIEETRNVDENYYIRNSEFPQFMAFLARK